MDRTRKLINAYQAERQQQREEKEKREQERERRKHVCHCQG